MSGPAFLAHIEQVLVPTLSPGYIVVTDNQPAQKPAGVRAAIDAAGASLRYLPPPLATPPSFAWRGPWRSARPSPDFNPTGMSFAKLKALLRKTAARTVPDLTGHQGGDPAVQAERLADYFEHAGYEPV